MLKCRLNIPADSLPAYQIITGFIMLQRQGVLDLDLHFTPDKVMQYPSFHMVEAIVGDGIKIAYDMLDGYNFDPSAIPFPAYLAGVDYYFKRSFDPLRHQHLEHAERVQPLGLIYPVVTDHPIFARLNGRTPIGLGRRLKRHVSGYYGTFAVEKFEDVPRHSSEGLVLFAARTWNPVGDKGQRSSESTADERSAINAMRAECIRLLRKELGNRFIGGFVASEYARQHYPDCILDAALTERSTFLSLVKSADICIASMGLHGSNGWKLGEYVAASKAIVSERLRYQVPGDFVADKNYLAFESAGECVEQAAALLADEPRMYGMKVENQHYYQRFLRPDQLVFNTLAIALEQSPEMLPASRGQ